MLDPRLARKLRRWQSNAAAIFHQLPFRLRLACLVVLMLIYYIFFYVSTGAYCESITVPRYRDDPVRVFSLLMLLLMFSGQSTEWQLMDVRPVALGGLGVVLCTSRRISEASLCSTPPFSRYRQYSYESQFCPLFRILFWPIHSLPVPSRCW